MKNRELPPLTEGQLEIMNIVWDRGEVTVGDVWRTLAERRDVSRNTISTIIMRLVEKGWLLQQGSPGTYSYRAAHSRAKVLPRLVRRLVDAAFQGSAEGLVLALLEGGRLSRDEVDRIKVMLEKVEREKREGRK